MTLESFILEFGNTYREFISTLPSFFQTFLNLFLLVIVLVLYALFIWKFYRFIGTKNIFKFNFNKYNKSSRPFMAKIIAGFLYLLEYILIIPFIIFFWYSIFTFFLIFLVEESVGIEMILLISAIVIASIRVASYLPKSGENIAKELAKILPFTFLALSIFNPQIFSEFFVRISSRLSDLPLFFSGILTYLLFIASIEVILRFFEFAFNIFGIEDAVINEESVPSADEE
ncbi:hypothetical protein K0A97_01100 [Patescibacteria group bacterium]|nr:hypothetical protein [Patescibacteria group bacterium]